MATRFDSNQIAANSLTKEGQPRRHAVFVQYSPEIAQTICDYIAEGLSLPKICKKPGMPARFTIRRWLDDHPEFAVLHDKAREDAAESFANEIVDLADAKPPLDQWGRIDSAFVQRQRLRVDARKWVASKLKARVYGDRLDVAHSGSVTVTRISFTEQPAIQGQFSVDNSAIAASQQLTAKLTQVVEINGEEVEDRE